VDDPGPRGSDFPDAYGNYFQWRSAQMRDTGGLFYQCSEVPIADVRDGTSRTYLIGEKYVNPDWYISAKTASNYDDNSAFTGFVNDSLRAVSDDPYASVPTYMPMQDTPGYGGQWAFGSFGSAHAGITQFVFCDGSVRGISYDINVFLHYRLAHRKDGEVIDESAL
jgi:hypothetical protein